jgi:2-hydroxyacyl-CoA lyase 1
MAEVNGGQLIAKQLAAAGIDTVFGVVAGPMLQTFAALPREGIRVVGCRHEEQAGFMAQAWGYLTKKPGVVVVGSGPGMTNTVTSLHVAQENGWPLVVLGGSVAGAQRGLGGFQEAAQVAFAAPACKWTQTVDSVARIPEYVHLALGKAVSGRPGAVYLDFPGQLPAATVPEEHVRLRPARPHLFRPHADPAGIAAIADLLAAAERPLVMVGKGAAWADAAAPLTRLVDLGIPFVASPMGRGTIPDDHPMNAGAARSAALAGADAVLMVGGRFNWIFQFGRPPRFAPDVRIAHIDIVAEEMYSAANVEVGVVADCAVAVADLCAALTGRRLRSAGSRWPAALLEQGRRNQAAIEAQTASDAVPISHYRLFREVRDCLDRDAIVAVDGEMTLGVGRVVLPSYLPRHRLNSGTTGCMGTGVPYAIGAKLACPDTQVVAVVGDYAFGAGAMDVETAARVGAPVTFVVANNEGIAGHQIQEQLFGPEGPRIASLLPAHYEKLAEMVGGYAERVERPADIAPALRRALAAGTVAVVNVMTDPKERRGRGATYLAG